jgi:HSP20 family protein
MRQEINRLFDEFFRDLDSDRNADAGESAAVAPWQGMTGVFTPTVNLSETDQAFEATVELPGMSEDEVDIKLTRDGLVISGEKRTETSEEDKERNYFRRERRYGSFRRTIPLPADAVERDACEATFANGVLTVRLPKRADAQPSVRRINVRRGE